LSDTVGFVRDLPHELVASFKSTLTEARQAHLLLHVVDASNPEAEQQAETVERVLTEIGIDFTNSILVLNKIDAVTDRGLVDVLRAKYAHSVTVSARDRLGLDRLGFLVAERLSDGFIDVIIETPVDNGRLLAYLAEHSQINETRYEESSAFLSCRVSRTLLPRLHSEPGVLKIEVRSHPGGTPSPVATRDDPVR
jgi:GTP-binding protein HflX